MRSNAAMIYFSRAGALDKFARDLRRRMLSSGIHCWSADDIENVSPEEIDAALAQATTFVIFFSVELSRSEAWMFEVGVALARHRLSGAILVPVTPSDAVDLAKGVVPLSHLVTSHAEQGTAAIELLKQLRVSTSEDASEVTQTLDQPSAPPSPSRSNTAAPQDRPSEPKGEMSTEAFLHKALSGDVAAIEELYMHYATRVYRLAFRLMGNQEDADYVIQEAFVAAYRRLAALTPTMLLSTWIYRITVDVALTTLRSRSASKKKEAMIEPAPVGVQEAVDQLPEDYRAVVVLRDFEEFDTREIASMLHLTEGATHDILVDARRLMRPHLRAASTQVSDRIRAHTH
jgi:RNA polymerase sigma-70 factor, ECF subfamily